MRILHVITSLQTGGAEHLLVDLLPRLRSSGRNTVDLLVFSGERTPFMGELESKGIRIHKLTSGGNVYNPLNILKLVPYVMQYDIVHTHNTACQLFTPIARMISFTHKPLVTTEHSSNNRRRNKWWCKPFDKWMYNRYAAVVCIADQPRRNLELHIGKKSNICTICNGVDTQRFIRPIKDITEQDQFIITMVAGLRMEKDHEALLRAVSRLPDNYHLQLVGGGEKEAELKALTAKLGLDNRVAFLGVRLDVPDILEQSDIVVLSSHWEGLSLSSIEGMASGRPFIASDVDGLREVVSGNGELFPHGDDEKLAEKIKHLCEHPDAYRQVAERCQKAAMQYDISVMVKKYLDLYARLCRV
jgi:glycosyltransferase involved in cell wall biosynthesis